MIFVISDCTGTLLVLKFWSSVSEGLWIWPEAAQRWQGTLQSTRSPRQWRGICRYHAFHSQQSWILGIPTGW